MNKHRAVSGLAVIIALTVIFYHEASAAGQPQIMSTPMSDGVELSTAVYLPDPGVFAPPYPTVLIRTPYPDVLGALPPEIGDMVIHYMVDMFGLALAVQDTRGTGESGGEPDAFFSDWKDGPETVEWLNTQEWCDGRVMQFGLSALAIPGYLAAPGASESLRCQFLGEAAPDMYSLAAFHGGVFKKDTVESWLSWVGASSMLSQLSEHRDCDSFWDPLILDRIPGDIHAAAMHVGGWYDVFTEGTIAGYRAYVDRGDEWASRHQYMVIGPWDHWTLANALGETSYGYQMQAALLSWTAFCLAGDTSQIEGWPHVRYYVMGSTEDGAPGNEWRTSPDWPLPTEYQVFEIDERGVMGGTEDAAGEDVVLPAAVPFNHANWSPVVGGRNLTGSSGPRELTRVLSRDDYVMFVTEPLSEPFESIGRMSAVLDVATSWGDADVIVRLADVYPDGSVILLSDGAARMSRRDGCQASVMVEAGREYPIEVDLLTSAMVFNTGHRIAIIVTATLYPKYEFNPTLEAESRANGPIGEAFVVHGGRLLMPVASPIVEVPEAVEVIEAVETVEPGADAAVAEPVPDSATFDAVDASPIDAVADIAADTGFDVPIPHDSGDDLVSSDARDATSAELTNSDVVDLDSGSTDDDESGRHAGGCSSSGSDRSGAALLVMLVLALAGMRHRRFVC